MLIETVKSLIMFFSWIQDKDYSSYMQQAEKIKTGEMDYDQITSRNGPLVYPALSTYIYLFLQTPGLNSDDNLIAPKLLSLCAHLLTMYFTLITYKKGFEKTPGIANITLLFCFSFLPGSLCIENLYNDAFSTMFNAIAIYCFVSGKNFQGVLSISAAFWIKMNAILYLPAVYLITSLSQGILIGTLYLFLIVGVQAVLGLPYLMYSPQKYLAYAYDFTRKFSRAGIMNWRILSEEMLLSSKFAVLLLSLNVLVLLYFLFIRWVSIKRIFEEISLWPLRFFPKSRTIDPRFVMEVFFMWKFISMVFFRGIAYQFTLWFWYLIPYVIWKAMNKGDKTELLNVLILFSILSYSYSSGLNDWSTILIQPIHFWLLFRIMTRKAENFEIETSFQKLK